MEYEKFMFNRRTPVKVLPCGFVVSKGCPILGATPDARVVDFGCTDYFGIAEVKCPCTKYHVTPLDACTDPKFFMGQTGVSECKLKEDHPTIRKSRDRLRLREQGGVTLLCIPAKAYMFNVYFLILSSGLD